MAEGTTLADWVGECIRVHMATEEEIEGTLEGATEQGIFVHVRGRRQEGPIYYSWKGIRWLHPVDRQSTTGP